MKQDRVAESIRYVDNPNGPRLGYSLDSGVQILERDGLFFKNLSRTGELQPFEDWRLPAGARAEDLAKRLTVPQIAGLMMNGGFMEFPSDPSDESAPAPWEVTERYRHIFRDLGIRHVMLGDIRSVEDAVRLSNNRQAFVESLELPVPLNICSDPRHGSDSDNEYNQGAGNGVSLWTNMLGLAATFDPETVRRHGEIAAKEYRALGIATALSPQVDLATEPRWSRVKDTFGEGPALAADMARAYVEGFQGRKDGIPTSEGWSTESVAAICKHWPGGGTGEGGRDAHHASGKYAVYPGGNFRQQLEPFVHGALALEDETGAAAGVMPYYTVSYGVDPDGVANAYSPYIIKTLLREKYGYRGMVCTDWEIVKLPEERKDLNFGIFWEKRCWGVEELSPQEQYYRLLMNTVDQFGGDNDVPTLLEGYELGVSRHGEAYMKRLMQESAVRILTNMFRLGLFENPYLELEETLRIVDNPAFHQAGCEAQLRSVVMVKNRGNALPLKQGTRVYIPKRHIPAGRNWRGELVPERDEVVFNPELLAGTFIPVDTPEEADAAIVFLNSPKAAFGRATRPEDVPGEAPKPEYDPISLQYRPYTAEHARAVSIAGDDPNGTGPNRSYRGKTAVSANENELDMLLETRRRMGGKPVIAILKCDNPCVVGEFEPAADGILIHFDVPASPLLAILSGREEPSGLLPMQFPANMETVETQCEDVPFDMECHLDSEGNRYDYGFGMNWSGVIRDKRTERYGRQKEDT